MTTTSSSTVVQSIQESSSTSITPELAYLKQISQLNKPQTVAQIKAQGEVKTKIGVIWFVGTICVMLIIIGGISMIVTPQYMKDVWIVIGPILSSAITGTVAFLTGEKQGSNK